MKDPDITNASPTEAGSKVSYSVLDAFDLLKANKDDTKLIGGAKIISQLQVNENEKDVQYVVKRLVRSLGANVPDQRTGYFATLVALLSKNDTITVAHLLELVKKELHANGSSKSEVGDVALGQILLCGAILRSKLILKCSTEEQTQIIQLILKASKKKSYLSSVAYMILLDFANGLDEEQFATVLWPNIKVELKKELKEHTLDTLYFVMIISKKFPDKVKVKKLLGVSEIICEDNIQDLCDKLLSGIDFNTVNHPIYKEIGTQFASSPYLKEIWTGIDRHLVKHNRNRELVVINILTNICNNIQDNAELIPELLSKNFFKLFMDWFKGLQTASKIRNKRDDEDDNKLMIKKQKEALNALAKAMKSEKVDDKIRVETLKKLLLDPGEVNFTEITGTAIVRSIISDLNKDGAKKLAKLLKAVLLNTSQKAVKDSSRKWYNHERVKAAELISYLVSHEAVKDDTEFKLTYMKILMCFGFFKTGGDENVPISIELAGSIKACFYRCFTSKFSNVDNLVTVLSSLCNFICSILEKEKVRTKLEKQFPKENVECWDTLMEVCRSIEKTDSKSKVDKVFLILLYQLGLFLFSEPAHVKIATSSIKELKSCYEHYRNGKKKKPKLKSIQLSEEPEWIEVLVEVLLSILSAESTVLRSVVQCVFRLLWEYLTPSSVGQIVSVLDPESESNPLTQDSDDEKDDEDEKGDDDDDDEENESKEKNGAEEDKNASEDSSDSDTEDEQEDDDEDMKSPEQLRLAVQQALGGAALDSDAESIDADMIDDEEGKKLDEALAEAFRQFSQSKVKKTKKDRKDKKALSDFRIRVLDLIDIYLEKDPSMDICLGMIAPLTRCLEFCIQDSQFSELENRLRKTIKNLTKIRKFTSTQDVTVDVLCDYLKANIEKGGRSHFLYQALGDIITYFSTFIISCSQRLQNKNPISPKKSKKSCPLLKILKETVQNYFQNRNCLLPIIFFHNVLQMEWDGTYELVPIVIDNVFNKEVRQFRRNEGIELLAGFYRAIKRSKPNDDALSKLNKLESTFENKLMSTLKNETQFAVKNNFFVVLKKLINTIKQFHESSRIKSNLDFSSIINVVGACKGTKSNAVQVKQNGQNNKKKSKKNKKKRKLEQVNGNVEQPPHKQKRIRKESNQSE